MMRKYLILLIPTFLIIIFFSITDLSLAIFNYNKVGNVENIMKSGTLDVTLEGFDNKLLVTRSNDSENPSTVSTYQFTIKNKGTLSSKYSLSIVDDINSYNLDSCTENKIPLDKIKYSIQLNENNIISNKLSENNTIIITDIIESNEEHNYTLKLWIDEESDNLEGIHFHGQLDLNYIVESSSF